MPKSLKDLYAQICLLQRCHLRSAANPLSGSLIGNKHTNQKSLYSQTLKHTYQKLFPHMNDQFCLCRTGQIFCTILEVQSLQYEEELGLISSDYTRSIAKRFIPKSVIH